MEISEEVTPAVITDCSDEAQQLAADKGATVKIGGSRACYIPALDEIHMPDRELFIERENISADVGFASTLCHELVHWTGHQSRLDRDLTGVSAGNKALYAKEELIAELGASFLCAELGFKYSGVADHAGYCQWPLLLTH